MTNRLMLSAWMVTVGLVACGGGGEAPAPPAPPAAGNEVPASALASSAAFGRYAAGLAASDRAEPLDVDQLVPPASESDEPIDLT